MEEENLCPVAPLGLSVFPTDPYVDSISNAIDIENPAKPNRDCVKREKGKRLLALTEK
jgi:hypothetical protein